jgi:hypothetical protein
MEVEVINGKRGNKYFIIWADGTRSWEPQKNLTGCKSMICLYEELLTEYSEHYLRRQIKTKEDMMKLAEKRFGFISQAQLDCSISKTSAKRSSVLVCEYIVID